MTEAILLLGSNLGERENIMDEACSLIEQEAGTIIAKSSIYESEPWGFEHENLFLNRALKIVTALNPKQLMETLLEIEKKLGRVRTGGLQARLIDIDILFYGDEKINTETLCIPHPRIKERLFTLLPLAEITQRKILPVLNKTAEQLIKVCPDQSKISLYQPIL